MERPYDITVFGATGYTGRLVAEHVLRAYGSAELAWAIAGRDRRKLEQVRQELGAPRNLPLVIADSSKPASLIEMVRQTKLVATAVGPYSLYGSSLVEACAAEGTDYVDITGESIWMRDMLVHEATAKTTGARLLFCCGFDSVPFELGVHFLQKTVTERYGTPSPRVRGRVRKLYAGVRGGMSGGSLATIMGTVFRMQQNPQLRTVLADPFALTPGFIGPAQPDGSTPYEDQVIRSWVAPFMMAAVNTKIVHRGNLLLGHPWGRDFKYDEMMMTDGPPTAGNATLNPFADPNMRRPGEGPSEADREGGCYDLLFVADTADGRPLRVSVKSAFDAGAGSTSRLLAESAVCLARDISKDMVSGGMWTCASALGDVLLKRLQANAGVTFQIESDEIAM
jgi:short subunit dehydrogenase-like uncharacterized protein